MVLRAVAVGLAFGALMSILPLELFMFGPVGLAALLIPRVQRARREGNRRLLMFPALVLSIAISAAGLAAALPFKYVDREHLVLQANCVSVQQIATASRARFEHLGEDALDRQVCFQSTGPSMREVATALEEVGVTMKYGYCGNSVTILWGASPIGGPRLGLVNR